MIRSMTAFARGERSTSFGDLVLEVRSVNHRYLDLSLRLPDRLRSAEGALRDLIRARVDRGKVDATLRLERPRHESGLAVDPQAVEGLVTALDRLRTRLGPHAAPTDPLEVLRWPGVVRDDAPGEDALVEDVRALGAEVVAALLDHRRREGARLEALVDARLAAIAGIVDELQGQSADLAADLRDRLRRRAVELMAELDPARLEQEVALLAQKGDVAEELDRLTAHVAEIRETLDSDGPAGRRLDFLAQELNREANTLASKAGDSSVAHRAVDLKVLIEQIREQIQNVE
ncbi:MAG: YicC/YloC family endoribonuclease [Pseudomonadales bacterium]|jgi:uncharacterized protein (TIGR00255 family)|nr:YicC/YloC family endoribonuclease [Pseudomonadales bacterium]